MAHIVGHSSVPPGTAVGSAAASVEHRASPSGRSQYGPLGFQSQVMPSAAEDFTQEIAPGMVPTPSRGRKLDYGAPSYHESGSACHKLSVRHAQS